MRVEQYDIDSYVHVIKRGARGMEIVRDAFDRERFLRILFYMNDEFLDENWDRIHLSSTYKRPDFWPKRKPLVKILAYTFMPNHFHLLLREIRNGGMSTFMRKVGQSMTNHFNEKYREHGSIFQGAYRSRTIEADRHFRYVAAYIMVKNVFELYPGGGLKSAVAHFNDAWEWACRYPFSSTGSYGSNRLDPILDRDLLGQIFSNPSQFKKFSRDVIEGGSWANTDFE